MVSTGVYGTSFKGLNISSTDSVKSDSSFLNDDFTRILDSQKENFKKSDDGSLNVKSEDSVNPKTEEIKNLFKKAEISEDDITANEEVVEEVASQLMSYYQDIVEKLAKEYNIPKEEVVAGIEELGFNPIDLLDMKNISKLVMNISGNNDMSMLLVDNKMSDLIKEFMAEAEQLTDSLKEMFDISDEELNKIFAEAEKLISADTLRVDEIPVKSGLEDDVVYDFSKEQTTSAAENNTVLLGKNEDGSELSDNNKNDYGNSNENVNNTFQTVTMESVVANIENAINNNSAIKESGISERIMNQILDAVYANVSEEATSLELQLNPESLGKVSVTVSAKEGILTAQIVAQTEIAKEAIESQIMVLKDSFESQGLKVEEVEVTLASRSFDQNLDNEGSKENNGSKSRKHISQEELDEINGIRSDRSEAVVEDVLKELGTTVSYKA